MKVGLFGGSFDPIHSGHLEPVKQARRQLGLEQVIYLPTAVPPHKPERRLAPPLARYAMVELAILREEGLFASPYELTLDRPAYTAETLEHFQRLLPSSELHLLIGSDSFLELPHWFRWRDVAAAARLVVLPRPGWDLAEVEGALAALLASGRAQVMDQDPHAVSSTRLRELLARGERPPAGWMPDLVVDFVHKYRLYR
ncbi:MAG TPA: nicotinate (nicotinamide) nucleotide adenylyltransferase [Thermoanaerobaculia bacterium]|nr:nicotinate (nicotinamide) nucleotide adenylyltransferase [Thermoanaerobaculia bacterium]